MLSFELARRLQRSGLPWTPALYDAFMIPDRDLDDRVFVISDLTIDVDQVGGIATIMFNGAVERSLDYIFSQDVLWLPTEGQLRAMLGDRFVTLTRVTAGFGCVIDVGGDRRGEFVAAEAPDAYGAALLHLIETGFVPAELPGGNAADFFAGGDEGAGT